MAQHAHAAERGDERDALLHHVLDGRQIAALGVGVVAVDIAAEDEAALVGLADVEMPRAEGDDLVDHGLEALRHEGLQHVALDGQAQARHRRDLGGAPGAGEADLLRADEAARRLHAEHAPALDANARDLAVLDDVDAALVRRAGIAPRHGVVAHRAAAPLQQARP